MKKFLIGLATLIVASFAFFIVVPAFAGKIMLPSAIVIGEFEVRFYGIILALSILLGYFVARIYSWRFGIDRQEAENFAFWLALSGLVGARLYYVAFAWPYFSSHPQEIYKIWHGGLSIYGALLIGLLFCFFWTRTKAYGFKQLFDLLGISLPLAQSLGRWGNFFNQEAFGLPTNLPWKMYIAPENRPFIFAQEDYFHPTFLYESLGMIIVFIILTRFVGKIKVGVLGATYLGLYSIVRFFIEPLRLDSVWIGNFRVDQVVALFMVIACGALLIVWGYKGKTTETP